MKGKGKAVMWCILLILAAVMIGYAIGVFHLPDWSVRVMGLSMIALLFFNVFYMVRGSKNVEK